MYTHVHTVPDTHILFLSFYGAGHTHRLFLFRYRWQSLSRCSSLFRSLPLSRCRSPEPWAQAASQEPESRIPKFGFLNLNLKPRTSCSNPMTQISLSYLRWPSRGRTCASLSLLLFRTFEPRAEWHKSLWTWRTIVACGFRLWVLLHAGNSRVFNSVRTIAFNLDRNILKLILIR
jgi:hypothetical protein